MMQVFHWVFLILFYLIFLCFYVFLEEKDIKVEQNYIFSHIFNKRILYNSN